MAQRLGPHRWLESAEDLSLYRRFRWLESAEDLSLYRSFPYDNRQFAGIRRLIRTKTPQEERNFVLGLFARTIKR